jgi:hypothetical protein
LVLQNAIHIIHFEVDQFSFLFFLLKTFFKFLSATKKPAIIPAYQGYISSIGSGSLL